MQSERVGADGERFEEVGSCSGRVVVTNWTSAQYCIIFLNYLTVSLFCPFLFIHLSSVTSLLVSHFFLLSSSLPYLYLLDSSVLLCCAKTSSVNCTAQTQFKFSSRHSLTFSFHLSSASHSININPFSPLSHVFSCLLPLIISLCPSLTVSLWKKRKVS